MHSDREGSSGSVVDRLVEAMDGNLDAVRFSRAPGRVNLMGDHTDYNDGLVLPAAIDRQVTIAIRPDASDTLRLRSLDYGEEADLPLRGELPRSPGWARLATAVLRSVSGAGVPVSGARLASASTVPVGAGLSSSAAFEVALACAVAGLAGTEPPLLDLARACQRAEHAATGVPTGLMDQIASLAGVADHALLLDCRTLTYEPVAIPSDLAIVVVHSGVSRSLADTPYAERRRACVETARRLGVPSLRDVDLESVRHDPIARHVVTENARVRATAAALATGDRDALGPLFAASHASLRDDFQASSPELDALVESAVAAGAIGARPTGAGWGGCIVALAPQDRVGRITGAVGTHRHWVCRATDGAGRIES